MVNRDLPAIARRLRQQPSSPPSGSGRRSTLFVNTFGLPVSTGITLFALALIVAWDGPHGPPTAGRVLLNHPALDDDDLVGYSSYASVTIRAAATRR